MTFAGMGCAGISSAPPRSARPCCGVPSSAEMSFAVMRHASGTPCLAAPRSVGASHARLGCDSSGRVGVCQARSRRAGPSRVQVRYAMPGFAVPSRDLLSLCQGVVRRAAICRAKLRFDWTCLVAVSRVELGDVLL